MVVVTMVVAVAKPVMGATSKAYPRPLPKGREMGRMGLMGRMGKISLMGLMGKEKLKGARGASFYCMVRLSTFWSRSRSWGMRPRRMRRVMVQSVS